MRIEALPLVYNMRACPVKRHPQSRLRQDGDLAQDRPT